VIAFRIDDDDRLTARNCLSDQQIEQAGFADTGGTHDQGMPDQAIQIDMDIPFPGQTMEPVRAILVEQFLPHLCRDAATNQGMHATRFNVRPVEPASQPDRLPPGSDVRKADHFRDPDELLVGEADSRAVLTSPPRLKRSEHTDSDAEE
jgi:hypothetical protein